MAILSFKHLKNRKPGEEIPEPIPAPILEVEKAMLVVEQVKIRSTYRIPSILPTALIHRTNYCASGNAPCPRYLPATKHDREALGIVYGQCLRKGKGGVGVSSIEGGASENEPAEVWKNIPASATVSRCWYYQNWRE